MVEILTENVGSSEVERPEPIPSTSTAGLPAANSPEVANKVCM